MCKWGGTKRMDPGAIQWSPVTGSEVTGNTETQEAPSEHQEQFFYCEGDWADVAQGDCEIFLSEDVQKLSIHGPGCL